MSDLVLFFDIDGGDGTMLHTGGAGQKAMELALREEFRVPEPFEAVHTAGRTDRGIENEVFARCGIPLTDSERQRFTRAYLDRLPDCLRELPGGLLPGVRPLLEELSRNSRVHLSLLTGNYAEGAWIKLQHFDIAHFFTGGAYGDHHPERDDVARSAEKTPKVCRMFEYVHARSAGGGEQIGFECTINPKDAMAWLRHQRYGL